MSVTTTGGRPPRPDEAFRSGFTQVTPQIKATLPKHIPFERFERAAMIAVQREPDLLKTNQRVLLMELQKCAADGLVPDGREAVIVKRWNSKLRQEVATYQPMVAGLRKLMRNSGEVVSLHAQVVYEGEPFRAVLGDEERIEHERVLSCIDDDKIVGAYAVATLKDGEKVRAFMPWAEIEKARNVNKGWEKGPWASWKSEMCRKTVVRRLFKSVPHSVDKEGERLQRAIERDDEDMGDMIGIATEAYEAADTSHLIDGEASEWRSSSDVSGADAFEQASAGNTPEAQ